MRALIIASIVGASGCDLIYPLVEPQPLPPQTCTLDEDCESGRCDCGTCSAPDSNCKTTNRRWPVGSPAPLDDACVPAIDQLDARVFHVCAAMSDRTARCWGANTNGQLGEAQPVGIHSSLPLTMRDASGRPLTGVVEMGVGAGSTCARIDDGSVMCWGDNARSQLGAGVPDEQSVVPLPVLREDGTPLTGARSLAIGFHHACAILEPGELVCWGHNGQGQIGDGMVPDRPTAVTIDVPGGQLQSVSAGGEHTCAVTDGTIACWGRGADGRLGDGVGADLPNRIPTLVAGLDSIAKVSAGNKHTCAIKAPPNEIYCWGNNESGELGEGATAPNKVLPTLITAIPDGDKSAIGADDAHTCATSINDVYCWGSDADGEIGDGPDDGLPETLPVRVIENDPTRSLVVGFNFTCVLGTDQGLSCWGANEHGELGLGDTANRDAPTELPAAAFCPVP